MTVDNFENVRDHLTFETPFDRYIIHIICRPKDFQGTNKNFSAGENQRLIRTYYVDSLEYFDKKQQEIKALCEANNARAYILPQVRNNEDCLLNLVKIVADNIKNPNAKPTNLIKSAYCGYHASRAPRWVIDIDKEDIHAMGATGAARVYVLLDLFREIRDLVKEAGNDPEELWQNWSVSGEHIITPKFNPMGLDEKFRSKIKKDGMTLLYFKKD